MHSPTQTASASLQGSGEEFTPSHKADDLTYQLVTVAAILLLLASLWVF